MNVIITGVAGLLGSRLADWLIENIPGIHVIGIDDLSGGYLENVNPKVELYKMNIVGYNIDEAFSKNIDYVFHFAAYAAEGLSPFIRKFNYTNNLLATANIINYCINYNVKRLVFTSSMAVYGKGIPPFDEKDQPNPIDPYGVAKYACEQDIMIAGDQHRLDWCIIRPHNVYGKNQNIWDKYRNVLGIWMYQYMSNQPMTIFGDGLQKRAFSYIDDCLECLWKAAYQENCSKQIINLGGTKEVTILEANQILKNVIGADCQTVFLEPRNEVRVAHPTCEKSIKLLGYKDNTSMEKGLKEMWGWAQKQPKRNRIFWGNYEVNKGIYEFWKRED